MRYGQPLIPKITITQI